MIAALRKWHFLPPGLEKYDPTMRMKQGRMDYLTLKAIKLN
jgi:hypothetical protein